MQASSNNIQDTARTDLSIHPSNMKVNETPLYPNIPINQTMPQAIAYSQFIPFYPQNAIPAAGNSLSSSMRENASELRNPIIVPSVPYMSMVSIGDGSQLPCNYSTNGEVILSHSAPAGQIRYDMNSYYAIQPPQQQYIPVQYIQYAAIPPPQPAPIVRQQPLSRPIDIPPAPLPIPSQRSNNNKMEEDDEEEESENIKVESNKYINDNDEDSLYGLNILSDMAEQFSNLPNEEINKPTQTSQTQKQQQQQPQDQQQQNVNNNNNLPKTQQPNPPKKREARRVYETCSTCNQHKPLTEFTLKRTGEHTHTCKVCSERKKNYYKRNIVKKHKRDEY